MEEKTEMPLWQQAYRIVKDVQRLTADPDRWCSLLRILRDRSAAMHGVIMDLVNEIPFTVREQTVRSAYEYAHDTEYLLFTALLWKVLHQEETAGMANDLQAIKREITGQILRLND